MKRKIIPSYKGTSDIKLNYDAVMSFLEGVDARDKLTPGQKAAMARQGKKAISEKQVAKHNGNAVPLEKPSNSSDNTSFKESSKLSNIQSFLPTQKEEKESLTDIVEDIVSCDSARKNTGISALGRIHCTFDGRDEYFWFTNDNVNFYLHPKLKRFGHFVRKNSDIAIKIQTTDIGTSFDYPHYNEIKRYVNTLVYLENRSDFQNKTIAIAGDNIIYQYRNIYEFLDALQQNREDIRDVELKIKELYNQIDELKNQQGTGHQRGQLTKSIKEYQSEYRILTQQQEDLKNITIYIRKQDEMRYSLIVDPIQTRIKSENLFDGTTLIIEGGPGTGKSTTMIHRLAYLTDVYAIDEDEKNKISRFHLNPQQRKQLRKAIDSNRDWMFFSPSKLLKEYLAEAMRKEGLKNVSQKVWNWKEYLELILQENYHILGGETLNAPFKVCNLTGTLFYQGSEIINEFTEYYLGQLRDIKTSLPKIEFEGNVYAWTSIAQNIEKRFEDSANYNIAQFVSLFLSLESVYGNDCKSLLRDKNDAIKNMAQEICALLNENIEVKSNIEDIFDLTAESDEDIDEIVDGDLTTSEAKAEEKPSNGILAWFKSFGSNKSVDEEKESIYNEKLLNEIQKWLKIFCYSRVNIDVQLSDEHQIITEELLPVMGDRFDAQIKKIGELIVFEQYAQYTRGVKAIMLNGIPAKYKKFRSHLIKSKFSGCDLKMLRDIMQRKQGKELHHQEQSLLLGFINTLVKQIKAATVSEIRHTYIDAYEEVSRPIIGVDEATDFSSCDIYAMQSLLARDFYSMTLCGDMMQRMTSYGIKSWEEIDDIVSNPKVEKLETSYRQSKKLLEVARQLYVDTLNDNPSYKAFMKSNKVPEALVYVSESEFSKIEWISKRISEVYRAYGEQLPSIAIFVNDLGYIPRFIENINNTDFFAKTGIKVLDGTSEAKRTTEAHICVYPIDTVKGMEFDVVFFHNIDNSSDVEMLKRYIYVGVSRAAFFLGITLSEENQEIGKYFERNKDWFKI